MSKTSGVLEHIIFTLMEKKITYKLNAMGKMNGLQEQIIVNFLNTFIYIIKHKQRIAYYIKENDQKRKSISKADLLNKIKKL